MFSCKLFNEYDYSLGDIRRTTKLDFDGWPYVLNGYAISYFYFIGRIIPGYHLDVAPCFPQILEGDYV